MTVQPPFVCYARMPAISTYRFWSSHRDAGVDDPPIIPAHASKQTPCHWVELCPRAYTVMSEYAERDLTNRFSKIV